MGRARRDGLTGRDFITSVLRRLALNQVMVAVMLSKWVGDAFTHSVYHVAIEIKGSCPPPLHPLLVNKKGETPDPKTGTRNRTACATSPSNSKGLAPLPFNRHYYTK